MKLNKTIMILTLCFSNIVNADDKSNLAAINKVSRDCNTGMTTACEAFPIVLSMSCEDGTTKACAFVEHMRKTKTTKQRSDLCKSGVTQLCN